MLKSKWFHIGLGVLVSAGLIGWLGTTVDWEAVGRQLKELNHLIALPFIALFFLQFYLRALRWRYLLPQGVSISTRALFDGILFGNFGNYILPLRAGEFLRPYIITRESSHSFSSAFVSVVIERFFDLATVLLVFGLMVGFLPDLPGWVYKGAFGLGVVAGAVFVFIVLCGAAPKLINKLVDGVLRFLPEKVAGKIGKFVHDFVQGASVLKNVSMLSKTIVVTMLIWGLTCLQYFTLLALMGLPTNPLLGVAITVILALAVAAPSAPGFIGVFQVACVAAFALFGIGEDTAATYAIAGHIYQYLAIIGYGVYLLLTYGLKLSDLWRIREQTVEL